MSVSILVSRSPEEDQIFRFSLIVLKRNSVPYSFHQTTIQIPFSHACSALVSCVKGRCRQNLEAAATTGYTRADNIIDQINQTMKYIHYE
jgi:hypothetical protein